MNLILTTESGIVTSAIVCRDIKQAGLVYIEQAKKLGWSPNDESELDMFNVDEMVQAYSIESVEEFLEFSGKELKWLEAVEMEDLDVDNF